MFTDKNGHTEENTQNIFSFLEEKADNEQKNAVEDVVNLFVTAYQIKQQVRVISLGKPKTEVRVIDTVYVKYGNIEDAKATALRRAQRIGECFVTEISERVIDMD